MKEKKTTNNSKKISPLSFSRATRTDFRTLLSWRERGLSTKMKKELLMQYLEWAEKPDSLDMLDFFHDIGVPYSTFQEWFANDPEIRHIHEYVKHILGSRFQKRARFPKTYDANPDAFMKTLRLYHPDWREAWSEDAELRTKEAGKSVATLIVETKAMPDCPDVPRRPEGTD